MEGEDLLKTECRLCGKRFKTNSQLYRHEETHVGTLQHACQYCGKRFKTSNNIRQHENYYCAGGPRRKSGGKAAEGRVGNLVDVRKIFIFRKNNGPLFEKEMQSEF